MATLEYDTQTTPATPGAGVSKFYPRSTDPVGVWNLVDQFGNDLPVLPEAVLTQLADFTGTNVTTAQPIFEAAVDTLTLPASTSWLMESCVHIHTLGATSHTLGVLFGGTATLTSIGYSADTTNAATEVLGASQRLWCTAASVQILTAATATATHHTVIINGIVRINGAGTFIPQYQWGTNAPGTAGLTLAGSYFRLMYLGSSSIKSVGPAS